VPTASVFAGQETGTPPDGIQRFEIAQLRVSVSAPLLGCRGRLRTANEEVRVWLTARIRRAVARARRDCIICPCYSARIMSLFSFFRRKDAPPKPASEREVLDAGSDLARKDKLVERLSFLPPDMKQVARDTALSRFLEVLLSHMRR
jgi:hypothetical protein